MQITARRLAIMRPLMNGPKSWTELRKAYYPTEERQASAASTSFTNKLKELVVEGYVQKVPLGYDLTPDGWEAADAAIDQLEEHPCARCNTVISPGMHYCVGCQEDLKAAGRNV